MVQRSVLLCTAIRLSDFTVGTSHERREEEDVPGERFEGSAKQVLTRVDIDPFPHSVQAGGGHPLWYNSCVKVLR